MNFFSDCLSRLKPMLRVSKDQEVAAALGLSKTAFSERKKRGSFPDRELRALAKQRPELGIDVDYVLTGVTEDESLRQRSALHSAAGLASRPRTTQLAEQDLIESYRACAPDVQEALLVIAARLAMSSTDSVQARPGGGHHPKAEDQGAPTLHDHRRKSL